MGKDYYLSQLKNEADNMPQTKDSNGNTLQTGDTVSAIKDLKVKGMSKTIKRGEKMKIKLIDGDTQNVECKIGKSTLVLKTEYFKKI